MGIVHQLLLVVLLAAGSAHARESSTWKRSVAGAEVDWSAGTITAQAGAPFFFWVLRRAKQQNYW